MTAVEPAPYYKDYCPAFTKGGHHQLYLSIPDQAAGMIGYSGCLLCSLEPKLEPGQCDIVQHAAERDGVRT